MYINPAPTNKPETFPTLFIVYPLSDVFTSLVNQQITIELLKNETKSTPPPPGSMVLPI